MARQREAKGSGGSGFRQDSPGAPGQSVSARTPGSAKTSPSSGSAPGRQTKRGSSQVIPDAVSQRMVRRIALATGIPSLLGMAVIVASYVLVSRRILSIPPVATLLGSGAFFLLGLLGLSYGVLSASWEDGAGSTLGFEQISKNIGRIRDSLRAMRQGSGAGS
ncbi:MAG: photosystem II biosynthesis protein [Cyanobium sp.]